MGTFDVDRRSITVFHIDDEYLFTEYFEEMSLFEALAEYYDADAYRFAVPDEAFDDVSEALREYYYEPVVVADEDLDGYAVVKEAYTPYAVILKQSVLHWSRDGYNFFLMKDELSVREAIEHGAEPIGETSLVLGL